MIWWRTTSEVPLREFVRTMKRLDVFNFQKQSYCREIYQAHRRSEDG